MSNLTDRKNKNRSNVAPADNNKASSGNSNNEKSSSSKDPPPQPSKTEDSDQKQNNLNTILVPLMALVLIMLCYNLYSQFSSNINAQDDYASQSKSVMQDTGDQKRDLTYKNSKKELWYPKPPDVRPKQCEKKEGKYKAGSSTVSFVIPYLNESFKHLTGTVGSILDNTPDALIEEIIFISDGNTDEAAYQKELEAMSPKIQVIRFPRRTGLIHAKMHGALKAKGDVTGCEM